MGHICYRSHIWHRNYTWSTFDTWSTHDTGVMCGYCMNDARTTFNTRSTKKYIWHKKRWIRNLLEALMTQKTHETHRALTTSVATTCNEEHIRQKEPSFMQWYICKCILGYTCFIYDTYDTSNKVKFMLYEVSKTHVIQETQKLRHFFFKFYCQKAQCHRHAHMTHWSFLTLITSHI